MEAIWLSLEGQRLDMELKRWEVIGGGKTAPF